MKKIFFALLISLPVWGAPCGGAPTGYWTNPDGSRGGWVGTRAKVQAGAFVAINAEVCDEAKVMSGASVLENAHVGGRAQILAGGEIAGRAKVDGEARVGGVAGIATKVYGDAVIDGSSVISGASKVFARAKVTGAAKVHNGVICQASVIESISVSDDYYCQTEDPEPADPGEIGKKTLLGVDSDRDGVRDDFEIWVNDRYSNTPTRDNYNMRMWAKQNAKLYNELLKNKNDKAKAKEVIFSIIGSLDCGHEIKQMPIRKVKGTLSLGDELGTIRETESESSELQAEFYNTAERVFGEFQTRRFMHGQVLEGKKKTKNGCEFKVRK